jgi:hypothetical protein
MYDVRMCSGLMWLTIESSERVVGATRIESSASQSARITAAPTPIGSRTVTTTYLRHDSRKSREETFTATQRQ